MAFVDDYSAWVTGPSTDANREGIQTIIDKAMDWEKEVVLRLKARRPY
jgi:hypothetical protein